MCGYDFREGQQVMASPWIEAGTLGVAAIAGIRALIEYVRVGRWKRAELASMQVAALVENDELAFACQALDWGVGPIIVPKRFRSLLNRDLVQHDVALLESALEPILNLKTLADPQGLLYRHSFDRLFGHFALVNSMIERRLFGAADVASMKYYLDLLDDYGYATDSAKSTMVFRPFVEKFGYSGVFELRDKIEKVAARPLIMKWLSRI
jgi:hypothetical protein